MSALEIKVYELTQCAGCQSCLRADENDVIQQLDHFVASKDVTDEIKSLREKVASAEMLVEALKLAKVTFVANNLDIRNVMEVINESLATYDKLSEGTQP